METIPMNAQRLREIIANPDNLPANVLDAEFAVFVRETFINNYKRLDLIGRLLDILDLAIWEHRVLWGTDADNEPINARKQGGA